MIPLPALALVALGQTSVKAPPSPRETSRRKPAPKEEAEVRYDVPVGTSSAFGGLVLQVERASAGDRAKAARLAGLLPRRDPAILWDDRKVPAASRAAFRAARDYALVEWGRLVDGLRPRLVTDPKLAARGLVFSFEPTLARGAGAAHFFGTDATGPRLETVLGLMRGDDSTGGAAFTGETDVHNEVLYALGAYLGLDAVPGFGGAMGRTDRRALVATSPGIVEAGTGERALALSTALRETLAKGRAVPAEAPRVWSERREADLGSVRRGEPAEVQFTVANNGDGRMLLSVRGDCGCLTAVGPSELGPGETGVVRARYDTSALGGTIRHRVVIRTNDPETPRLEVPLSIFVRLPSRVLLPSGPTHLLDGGSPFEMFLVGDGEGPVALEGARVAGVEGTLTTEAWSGTLPDPELGEGPRRRQGYRLRFAPKAAGFALGGRRMASLEVRLKGAGDAERTNFAVQRGIAPVPLSLTFGEPDSTPMDAETVLGRPGRPFAIAGFGALPPGYEAFCATRGVRAERHTVRVRVRPERLGRAAGGVLPSATLRVRTDDPDQPEILVPIVLAGSVGSSG